MWQADEIVETDNARKEYENDPFRVGIIYLFVNSFYFSRLGLHDYPPALERRPYQILTPTGARS